jgi:hypothetical protein
MTLNDFVKNTLMEISRGVKGANSTLQNEGKEPSFALKNSAFFEDKSKACIKFDIALKNEGKEVYIAENYVLPENSMRVSFTIVQVQSIS